jgi:hypothetical protein
MFEMCDQFSHTHPNRLALTGEHLLVHRFPCSTIGLASPADLSSPFPVQQGWRRWWEWIKAKWTWRHSALLIPAVCVPPGSRLIVHDIPEDLQKELRLHKTETATFDQLSTDESSHLDALRFAKGEVVPFDRLSPGQRVEVLSLEPALARSAAHVTQPSAV